jgi:hypothetical protein
MFLHNGLPWIALEYKAGRPNQGLPYLHEALECHQRVKSPDAIEARQRLIKLYQAWDKPDRVLAKNKL